MNYSELLPKREEIDRKSGIGGSEVAAVLGLHPYMSPFDVWLEKTGRASAKLDTPPTYWGTRLQRVITEEYEIRRKVSLVTLFDEPRRHPERPWQIGSPDALNPSVKTVVEAKAPGLRQGWKYGPEGSDEIPDEHLLQGHWYMSVLDYDEAHLAVLLGGQDFRIYEIKRDRDLEAALLERVYDFWTKNVKADFPPEVTDTERTRDWLKKSFPREAFGVRKATETEAILVERYHTIRLAALVQEEMEGNLAAQLKALIGEAAGIEGPGWRITYKAAKDGTKIDWERVAGDYRATLDLIVSSTRNNPAFAEINGAIRESVASTVARHTSIRPGSRRFLPRWAGEGDPNHVG